MVVAGLSVSFVVACATPAEKWMNINCNGAPPACALMGLAPIEAAALSLVSLLGLAIASSLDFRFSRRP
jgi:hypothetical protein